MPDDRELNALIAGGESDRVEFTAAARDLDKIRRAICAFANDLPNHRTPGFVFIGLNDDGTCSHLAIDDQLLLTLGGLAKDGKTLPFPTMYVEKRMPGGCEVAVVRVEPSGNPPVKVDGRCWIRTGPRRGQASQDEERRLTELPDYPAVALRELIRNAVIHRNYENSHTPVRVSWFSDRVQIVNPGPTYGEVTRDNLGDPGITAYRNPTIAEAMKSLGFMERFGTGIQRARAALGDNGNPPPEFSAEGPFVSVTVGAGT